MNILLRERLLLLMMNLLSRKIMKYSKDPNLPLSPLLHLRHLWLGKKNSTQNTRWKKLSLKRSLKLKYQESNGSLASMEKSLNHNPRMKSKRLKRKLLKLSESRLKMSYLKDEMIYLSHL